MPLSRVMSLEDPIFYLSSFSSRVNMFLAMRPTGGLIWVWLNCEVTHQWVGIEFSTWCKEIKVRLL